MVEMTQINFSRLRRVITNGAAPACVKQSQNNMNPSLGIMFCTADMKVGNQMQTQIHQKIY
jgi:hypothetical protein